MGSLLFVKVIACEVLLIAFELTAHIAVVPASKAIVLHVLASLHSVRQQFFCTQECKSSWISSLRNVEIGCRTLCYLELSIELQTDEELG